MSPRKPFTLRRFAFKTGLLLLLVGGGLWLFLRQGVLGGYFVSLPVIPLFFWGGCLLATWALRRLIRGGGARLAAYFTLGVMGKLLLDVAFVVVGLVLLPEHRFGFVVAALLCHLLTLILMVRAVQQP